MLPSVTFAVIFRNFLKFCYINKILRLDYFYCRYIILRRDSVLRGGCVMTA